MRISDWSSDVCSSDLLAALTADEGGLDVVFRIAEEVEFLLRVGEVLQQVAGRQVEVAVLAEPVVLAVQDLRQQLGLREGALEDRHQALVRLDDRLLGRADDPAEAAREIDLVDRKSTRLNSSH